MMRKVYMILLITIFFMFFFLLNIVKAFEVLGGGTVTNDSGGGKKCEVPAGAVASGPTPGSPFISNNYSFKFRYYWDALDYEGNVIDKVVAGTRFVATLKEYREETYTCSVPLITHYTWSVPIYEPCACISKDFSSLAGSSATCNCFVGYESQSEDCVTGFNSCDYNTLEDFAKTYVKKIDTSTIFTVTIPDSNDYNCKGNKCEDTVISNPKKYRSYTINKDSTFTIKLDVSYEMNKTCINVKTGKVRYLGEGYDCNEYEYEIPKPCNSNDLMCSKWSLFTPLNMKTGEEFVVSVAGDSSKLDKADCIGIIDKNPTDYYNLIKPASGGTLKGKKIADAKAAVGNGCYLINMNMTVKAEQQFYNEEKDTEKNIKFKGFSFSYKPIDISNPFPNVTNSNYTSELTKTNDNGKVLKSYWYNWYENYVKNNKQDLNIKESFNDVTYVAEVKDTNGIKSLGSEYANWDNMNIDGTNTFVSDSGFVVRNSEIGLSFYKLGCGPLNSAKENPDETENPLYLEECKEVTKK